MREKVYWNWFALPTEPYNAELATLIRESYKWTKGLVKMLDCEVIAGPMPIGEAEREAVILNAQAMKRGEHICNVPEGTKFGEHAIEETDDTSPTRGTFPRITRGFSARVHRSGAIELRNAVLKRSGGRCECTRAACGHSARCFQALAPTEIIVVYTGRLSEDIPTLSKYEGLCSACWATAQLSRTARPR